MTILPASGVEPRFPAGPGPGIMVRRREVFGAGFFTSEFEERAWE